MCEQKDCVKAQLIQQPVVLFNAKMYVFLPKTFPLALDKLL